MPVRDPITGEVCGAVDISGFRDAAHPHTLTLTATLVVAVEQMLRAREAERRTSIMQAMMRLASRWPADTAIAVDRTGSVIGALHEFGASLTSNAAESTRRALAEAVKNAGASPTELNLPIAGGRAIVYPVRVDGIPVGACLVIPRENQPGRETSRRNEVAGARTRYGFHDLIGTSPELRQAIEIASAAAETELPVLLQGESGTGKELFAQGIHAAGRRSRKPFVVVNCAALPRELVESELFGYVGGAFSGARREGSIGKFEAANGGTIFLDEVAELPATAQAALLRVLQEGEIAPVGSPHTRNADVRVIAATNRDLASAVAEGSFRSDLYYRLNVLGIDLPPLRDRVSDIDELARRFLAEASADLGRPDTVLNNEHFEQLRQHRWPGNVRELKNAMRKVAALGPRVLDQLKGTRPEAPSSPLPSPEPAGLSPRDQLMRAVRGSRTRAEAAKRLGVTRSTLYRRMEKLGLRPERVLREDVD
jgi:transcriptional regulator with PAS, ATPase and Fis domain